MLARATWQSAISDRRPAMPVSRCENQLEILQKLDSVEREIAEARKQALYRNCVPRACFLEGYCNRELSFILNLETRCEENVVFAVPTAFSGLTSASMQFSVLVSHGDSSDVAVRFQTERKKMLIGDVQIVKSPDGTVMPSVVWLNLGHNAIPDIRTAGVYLNPVKGALNILPRLSNWEFGMVGEFVGQESTDRATPCEIQSTSQIVESIASNERQII